MATKRKQMSQLFMRTYDPDMIGSQPVSETPTEEIRLGRDGRQYRLKKADSGEVVAAYRQLTKKEAESFGWDK